MTVASEAPAEQTTNMAASPQPVLEQEIIASVDPAAANNLAADTTNDQAAVTAAENQVSDVPATSETDTDGIVETEGLTVIDAAASVTTLEEGVAESAVTDTTVLEATAAANGETDTLAPAADIIINIVATDTTVVQTAPVIEGEIVETEATPNEVIAEAVNIDTVTGEDILFTVH